MGLTQEDTLRGPTSLLQEMTPLWVKGHLLWQKGSLTCKDRVKGEVLFIYLFFFLKILELFLPEIRGLGAGKPIMHLQI